MAKLDPVRAVGVDLPRSIDPPHVGRELIVAGAVCLAVCLLLLGAELFAFELVVAAAAMIFSGDGIVEGDNRRALSAVLASTAAIVALGGLLLIALASPTWRATIDSVVAYDPLRRLGFVVPSAYPTLISTAVLGALVIGGYLVSRRIDGFVGRLYEKEGPFELATVGIALAAAVWCFVAAVRFRRHMRRSLRTVPALHAGLALALFVFAMEELNWGQTLLGFETPASWAAINYQQETSLHNLLDMNALNFLNRAVGMGFGLGVLALIALACAAPRSVAAAIAPPASLTILAAMCALAGVFVHGEVLELLLALFFASYGYRAYVASRSRFADASA